MPEISSRRKKLLHTVNRMHDVYLIETIIMSTHCTRSLKLLRTKALKLVKTTNRKKDAQKAQPAVRKSAISSAIKTISKLSARKKLPPIVKQQRLARRQAQKLARVEEVKHTENAKKSSLTGSQRIAQRRLDSTRLGPKRRNRQKNHTARAPNRQRQAPVGSSFGKDAIYRQKNLMSRYQF